MNYLTVDLYKDFECIADACPNTCCVGWGIIIDKLTYEKMKEHEEELDIPAKDWLVETDMGIMVKLQDCRCPMLNNNNLCKVVTKLGPEFLSNTCTQYPRIIRQYGNVTEAYLQLSCPVVIDKLMKDESVQFDFNEDNIAAPPYEHSELYLYESAVRASMIELIQCFPDITLSTRLYASYKILEKAVQLYQNGHPDIHSLRQETNSYFQENTIQTLDKQLCNVINEAKRYHFLQQLQTVLTMQMQTGDESFLRLLSQTYEYFTQNNLEKYLSEFEAFRTCIQDYRTFYTNYWVYNIFAGGLEIPDYELVKEKLICDAAQFCFIQYIALVAFVNNNMTLNRDEYIYIISSVSRQLNHSESFRNHLMNKLMENKVISAAGLLLLLLI